MNHDLGIRGLLVDYRSGERVPAEILRAAHARARGSDQPVWTTLLDWEAIAEYLDRLGRFRPELPLYGIPFAIKDNIDLAGTPTTAACPEFARVPERSAFVVERLIAAGAIPFGKTNMDQFATGLVGTRTPYGACRSVARRSLHLGRLELRLGGRRRRRHGQLRAGHRHRRVRPGSGGLQRDRRPQAVARPAQHERRRPGLPNTRLRLGVRARRRRRRPGPRGGRGLRPGRSVLARRSLSRHRPTAPPPQPRPQAGPRPAGRRRPLASRRGSAARRPGRWSSSATPRPPRPGRPRSTPPERSAGGWSRSTSPRSRPPPACSTRAAGSPSGRLPSATSSPPTPDAVDPVVGEIIGRGARLSAVDAFRSAYRLAALRRATESDWERIDASPPADGADDLHPRADRGGSDRHERRARDVHELRQPA